MHRNNMRLVYRTLIALKRLQLPVLLTLEILEHLGLLYDRKDYAKYWAIARQVKHLF